MKVLHVVTLVDDDSSYGGPVSVALTQLDALGHAGHQTRLVAGWRGGGEPPRQLEGVPTSLARVRPLVPGMRFSALFSFKLLARLSHLVRSADVVHIHLARDLTPLVAGLTARLTRTAYVVQTHGMVVPDSRLFARLLDRVATVPILRGAYQRYSLTAREDAALTSLVGPQSPTSRLRNAIPRPLDDARDETSIGDHEPEVLFLARLHPRKRVADFLEAAAMLLDDSDLPPVKFAVVGPDDGDAQLVEDFNRERGTSAVTYEGAVPHQEVRSRLRRASVYVLPSEDEPFPMSLLEALAVGVPSVCSDSCGIASELKDRGAVLTFSTRDVGGLADAIRHLLLDPERARRQSVQAIEVMNSRFGVEAVCQQLLRDYTQAVDS